MGKDVDLRNKKRYEVIHSENRKITLLGMCSKINDSKASRLCNFSLSKFSP